MFHDGRVLRVGTERSMWVTRVIMESWCWDEDAGKVSVVMRSGACDSVRSIGRRCDRPGTKVLLGSVVVSSRRRVV